MDGSQGNNSQKYPFTFLLTPEYKEFQYANCLWYASSINGGLFICSVEVKSFDGRIQKPYEAQYCKSTQ